jgi:hypothetical protein
MNYSERWYRHHCLAQNEADFAYAQAATPEARYDAYRHTYERVMQHFARLESMRKPTPTQETVDRLAAQMLQHCPECDLPTPTGRCAHCDYQLEA